MRNNLLLLILAFFLTGCQSKAPSEYNYAADYAHSIYERMSCGGVIYASTKPAGYAFYNGNNEWEFLPRKGSGCEYLNLTKLMNNFCVAKDGQIVGEWCDQSGYPLFRVLENQTYENKGRYSRDDWLSHAKKQGFLTISQMQVKRKNEQAISRYDKIRAEKNRKERDEKSAREVMRSDIGTTICRVDSGFSDTIYKGFVEGRSNSKLKVRLFFHGGGIYKFPDENSNTVLWLDPYGWYVCK